MGWAGYGKYDGDGTSSTQTLFVEKICKKFKITLLDPKGLSIDIDDELYMADVSKPFVHESVAKAVSDNIDYITEKLFSKPRKVKNEQAWSWSEDAAIDYFMLTDFLMNHKQPVGKDLKEKTLSGLVYLMGDHSAEFDKPASRRRVISNFYNKLNDYDYKAVRAVKPKKTM